MMWRLYGAAIPLLWLYLVSITSGNTNDTVADITQQGEQQAHSNPLATTATTTTTTTTQHGTNSTPTTAALAAASATTTTTLAAVASKPATKADSAAKASPHVADDATRTRVLPTTPQTLLATSLATSILNESIITTLTADGPGNSTSALSATSRRNISTSIDYLLNGATTVGPVEKKGTTTQQSRPQLPPPREPLEVINNLWPVIVAGPKNKTEEFSTEVRLTCRVESETYPEILWEFNGMQVGDNNAFWTVKRKPRVSTLKIKGASLEHAGMYRCLVRNQFHTVVSPPAHLVVEMAPVIVEGPGDHKVQYGTLLNLTCKVQAFPPPLVAWFRDRDDLLEWTNHNSILVNVTQSANYTCLFRNQVKKHDRLTARAGQVTVVGVRPSYCATYNGATCRDQIYTSPSHSIFVDGDDEEPKALDVKLSRVFAHQSFYAVSQTCQEGLRELLCHATHPNCAYTPHRAISLPICRRDCQKVQDSCEGWSAIVNRNFDALSNKIRDLGLTSCENLPDTRCTPLWVDEAETNTPSTSRRPSSPGGDVATLRITQDSRRTPSRIGIEDEPEDTTNNLPFLILVITIPAASIIGIVALSAYLVKRHKSNTQFNLPKNIDLDMKDNPMYGKDFNVSFNPQLAYLEYDRNCVIYEKDIGEGAFGRVFKATCPKLVQGVGESSVAVKVLKTTADKVVTEYFNREAQMVARFSHDNIIKLLGVCFVGKPLCLLLEYMSEGDLEDFLHSRSPHLSNSRTSNSPGSGLKNYQKLNMAKQIACGMAYLNERRFVHRDIATRNCLVNSNMDVKISDFGLARYLGHKDSFMGHKEEHIPIRWTSPEALWDYQFTFSSDVWSFGVLLWEIFSYAEQPYLHLSHEDVFLHTRQGYRLGCPENTPQKVHQIMGECWQPNPAHRPLFSQLQDSLASMECEWVANGEETED